MIRFLLLFTITKILTANNHIEVFSNTNSYWIIIIKDEFYDIKFNINIFII